jgi:3D (Asp-Asp-Asp) domain-containing protein
MLFAFGGAAYALDSSYVTIVVNDDGEMSHYLVRYSTLDEFYEKEGIVFSENDIINVITNYGGDKNILVPGCITTVEISRAFVVNAKVGNSMEFIEVKPGTVVGQFISEFERQHPGLKAVYDGYRGAELTPGQLLAFAVPSTVDESAVVSIPFETLKIENNDLDAGLEIVAQTGVEGEKQTIVRKTLMDGQEILSEVISETITREPVAQIFHIGTKATVAPAPTAAPASAAPAPVVEPRPLPGLGEQADLNMLTIVDQYTLEATAYSPESVGKTAETAFTATGMRAEYGVVAVDPRVIPLGTWLYVENYGHALAADTGSAIKGMKIDLFYNTRREAILFGRRNVNVYILAEPTIELVELAPPVDHEDLSAEYENLVSE